MILCKILKVVISSVLLTTLGLGYVFSKEEKNESDVEANLCSSYKIIESCEYKDYKAKLTVYEHLKTGAHVVHWSSKDIDKGVAVAYKTYPKDNSGVNHVLEHCVCSGSSEYNDTNLFFNVNGKVNNTYMNAMTGDNFTVYFVGTVFEKQLLKFTEMLMNCTLHPMFLHDKRIFYREAHRTELFKEDGPLHVNGTVFNEMSQSYSDGLRNEYFSMANSIFQDNNLFDSGGIPDCIESLTYESVVKTWEQYYHPSNCLVYLYGDIDENIFLKSLDKQFFSHYEKREINFSKPEYSLNKKNINKEIIYPSSFKDYKKNGCSIYKIYSVKDICSTLKEEDYFYLTLALNHGDSPFIKNIRKQMPYANGTVSCNFIEDVISILFSVGAVDKKDKENFEKIVLQSIDEIKNNGFSNIVLSDISTDPCAKEFFKVINKNNKLDMPISIGEAILMRWPYFDDWSWVYKMDSIKSFNENDVYRAFNLLIGNDSCKALVTTIPSSDIAILNAKQREEDLQKAKMNMDSNQKNELKKFTHNMSKWLKKGGNKNSYKAINNISMEDLKFKVVCKDVKEIYEDGIRVVTCKSQNNGLYHNSLSFGLKDFTKKEKLALRIMCSTFKNIGTSLNNCGQIKRLIRNNFHNIKFSLDKENRDENRFTVFKIEWSGLVEKYKDTFNILKDIILNTDFSDFLSMQRCLTMLKNDLLNKINNNSDIIMVHRGLRSNKGKNAHTASDIKDLYKFTCEIEDEYNKDPNKLINNLKNVLYKALCSSEVTFCSVSDYDDRFKDDIVIAVNDIRKKCNNYNDVSNTKIFEDYKEEKSGRREALITGNCMQTNGIVALYPEQEKFDLKFSLMGKIITDRYLLKNIRGRLGAYWCGIDFNDKCMIIISSSDPNIFDTWNVINGLVKWLNSFKISQRELDEYKVKLYCEILYKSYHKSCMDLIYEKIGKSGYQPIEGDAYLDYIKNIKVSDLKNTINAIKSMIKNGYFFTAGNEDKIKLENKNFDNIISA